jgi:hypothetical protein
MPCSAILWLVIALEAGAREPADHEDEVRPGAGHWCPARILLMSGNALLFVMFVR